MRRGRSRIQLAYFLQYTVSLISHSIHAITQDTYRMITRTPFTPMFILVETDTTKTPASGVAVDLLNRKDEELSLSTKITLAGKSAVENHLKRKISEAQRREDLQRYIIFLLSIFLLIGIHTVKVQVIYVIQKWLNMQKKIMVYSLS